MRAPTWAALAAAAAVVATLWWAFGNWLLPVATPARTAPAVAVDDNRCAGTDPPDFVAEDLRDLLETTPTSFPVQFLAQFARTLQASERAALPRDWQIDIINKVDERDYLLSVRSTGDRARLDGFACDHAPAVLQLSTAAVAVPDPIGWLGIVPAGQADSWVWFNPMLSAVQVRSLLDSAGVDPGTITPVHPDLGIWQLRLEGAANAQVLEPFVLRLEELPEPQNDLDQVRQLLGLPAPDVEQAAPEEGGEADGTGLLIAQWELCPPLSHHVALAGRVGVGDPLTRCAELVQQPDNGFHRDARVVHATQVAGVMVGQYTTTAPAPGVVGIAPDLTVRSYSILDRTRNYFQRLDAARHDIRVANNSWGYTPLYSSHPDTGYTTASWYNDALASGRDAGGNALRPALRLLMVTTTGNTTDTGDWHSARIGNTSKNSVAVGALAILPDVDIGFAAAVAGAPRVVPAGFSGRGPTRDGRRAPVLVAPGTVNFPDAPFIDVPGRLSDVSIPDQPDSPVPDPDDYGKVWGTSFAAPAVAAIAGRAQALLQRECGLVPPPEALRAALVQGAQDLVDARQQVVVTQSDTSEWKQTLEAHPDGVDGLVGPDHFHGWGLPLPAAVLAAARTWVAGSLEDGMLEYRFDLPEGADPLKVTLVWDDPPFAVGAEQDGSLLHNNLDLEVVHLDTGRRFLPWIHPVGAPPSTPAVQTVLDRFAEEAPGMRDDRHTIEQVLLTLPPAGAWAIRVRATRVGLGPQVFALTSSTFVRDLPTCGFAPAGVAVAHGPLPDVPIDLFTRVLIGLAILVLVIGIALLLDRVFGVAGDSFAGAGLGGMAVLLLVFLLAVFALQAAHLLD